MMLFDVTKENLLELLDTMRDKVEELDFDNSLEVYVFASSLVSIGNSLCLSLMKSMCKKK